MIYDPASTTYQTTNGFQIPVSRTPFVGNTIPVSRMDPAWSKIIQLYPNPNQTVITGNAPTNDYYYNTTGALTTDQEMRALTIDSAKKGQPLRIFELVEYVQKRRRSAAWRSTIRDSMAPPKSISAATRR